ncbi:MAG: CoB--CoM heterodisulfide reductase iron-sulfur subunit A family protein [Bacillota bacterium]|nr:CoB--CoM heterodisulfide reductase iron-sulfur subunit A family protein [Bacillota bacterium]
MTAMNSVLVLGGGIAGVQTALDLAGQGFKVYLVEKEPSIGGRMIQLQKVFPTLDCPSCIFTPKMVNVANHPGIDLLTYAEVESVTRRGAGFIVNVVKKPRYVDEERCVGCGFCENVCPVDVPSEFENGLGVRKAIYIPFAQAVPKVALVDLENCVLCGTCERVCRSKAVDFSRQPETVTVEVGAVVLATGFRLFDPGRLENFGGGRFVNVIPSLTMERLLVPNGPYGAVVRPSDGKIPRRVAFILCVGSRTRNPRLGFPYCSRVCCMYTARQAQSTILNLKNVAVDVYYMDIRAYGKGYEEFYRRTEEAGVRFVKGRVASITEKENKNLVLRAEIIGEDSRIVEEEYEMVVLALGIRPQTDLRRLFPELAVDDYGFVRTVSPKLDPTVTNIPGVFVAGVAEGPKDIVDTVMQAGAAAMRVSCYLAAHGDGGRETSDRA